MNKAKYCVLTCIDFRFQEKLLSWLKSHHMLGESDIIMIAGCSKDIVKPTTDEDFKEIIRQIETSVKLHNPATIMIIDHQDCGGYAVDNTIPKGQSYEDDKSMHEKYSITAKEKLQDIFPNKKILTYYVSFDHDIEPLN